MADFLKVVSLEHTLSDIEDALNHLAYARVVDGPSADGAVARALDEHAATLEALDTLRARDLAGTFRALAAAGVPDEDTLSAALAVIARSGVAVTDGGRPHALDAAACAAASIAPDDELGTLRGEPEMAELFIAEALDHLGTIEATLLSLEDRPDDARLLDDIFRPFHTVKGNAGALGLLSVQSVAHAVENVLDRARSGSHRMGQAEVDVVLRAVDVLTAMITDVGRQLAGHPAASLAAAAQSLIGEVERLIGAGGQSAVTNVEPGTGKPEPLPAAADIQARRFDHVPGQTAIKVGTRKLDTVVDAVGELIIVQSLIQQDPALAGFTDSALARNLAQLQRITADLQRNAMALRMVPIRQAFQKIPRVVRDLSKKAGKPVELVLGGEDTELDRKVVEEITDPLMHMVRNSVDHGLESPDVRTARGKRAQGRLSLTAYHQGGHIVVEVADDGGGLDTERIRRKAVERGLLAPDATPPPEEIHRMIFEPGLSTAERITEISGRGVGMDVVRRNIEGLQGRIEIRTEAGRGTTFFVKLPLTLAVLDGLVVGVGGTCASRASTCRRRRWPQPRLGKRSMRFSAATATS